MNLKRIFRKIQRTFKINLFYKQNGFKQGQKHIQNNIRQGHNNFQNQNSFQGKVQNCGQRSYAQNQKVFQQDSHFGYQN